MLESMQVESGNVHRRQDRKEKIPQKHELRARSDWGGQGGVGGHWASPLPIPNIPRDIGRDPGFPTICGMNV